MLQSVSVPLCALCLMWYLLFCLLPLLPLPLHHPISPCFPKLPHQTAGLTVSLGYTGKSPLLPVTLLIPSSKGPLCISTISSPLSASSPKFLGLGPPHSLASYIDKLMVSPNSLHIPFTLPAPPSMESSFSFGYPQLALRTRLVFPAAAFAHIPCKLQALVPGPRPQILFLPPIFHSHLGTFLGTQHPQTPVPKRFSVPTHLISPLSSKPALPPSPHPSPVHTQHHRMWCGLPAHQELAPCPSPGHPSVSQRRPGSLMETAARLLPTPTPGPSCPLRMQQPGAGCHPQCSLRSSVPSLRSHLGRPLHGLHRAPACKQVGPCPHAESST